MLKVSQLFCFLFVVFLAGDALSDKITSLPGYSGPDLSMYSGYLTVSGDHKLFYWFIESESNPSTDPVILWLNGGPGCSSLGGLWTENGPLRANADGTVSYTDLGWTKFANMLYLEAPIGVGFSYIPGKTFYHSSDNQTALDNYLALQAFFEEFPSFQSNDLWIAGESYAGVYIPTLADNIVSDKSNNLFSQLQGLMVGNPVFRCGDASPSVLPSIAISFNLYYWHGLVSFTHYNNWIKNGCNVKNSLACDQIFVQASNEIGVIDQQLDSSSEVTTVDQQPSLDPDDLYQDFCTGNGTLSYAATIPINCDHSPSTEYLNRQDVQEAIHAHSTTWRTCSIKLSYDSNAGSMNDYYNDIFQKKSSTKVLVYSGDIDIATVPFATTQPCVQALQTGRKSEWQPWFVNGATAGYFEEFERFTFATVKGAGHECPEYQPLTSFQLATRFISTQQLNV